MTEEVSVEELRKNGRVWRDRGPITEKEREDQTVVYVNQFGKPTYLLRDEFVDGKVPEQWRSVVKERLDEELRQLRGYDVEQLNDNVNRIKKDLDVESYTECFMNSSWLGSVIASAIGLGLSVMTRRYVPLVIMLPAGTAFDFQRGYQRCKIIREEEQLLERVRGQRQKVQREMDIQRDRYYQERMYGKGN